MKNFSFKKVLAVTLAAATALTFAPVSTLGLTGVVEAQAAAISLTNGFTEKQTGAIGNATDTSYTVYVPVGIKDKTYTLNLNSNFASAAALTKDTATDNGGATATADNAAKTVTITADSKDSVTTYKFTDTTAKTLKIVTYSLSSILAATDRTVNLGYGDTTGKQLVKAYTFADGTKASFSMTSAGSDYTFTPAGYIIGVASDGTEADITNSADSKTVTVKAGSTGVADLTWDVQVVPSNFKFKETTAATPSTDVDVTSGANYTYDGTNWVSDAGTIDGKITVTADGVTESTSLEVAVANSTVASATYSAAASGQITVTPTTSIAAKTASTTLYLYASEDAKNADAATVEAGGDGVIDGDGAIASLTLNFKQIGENSLTTTSVKNTGEASAFKYTLKDTPNSLSTRYFKGTTVSDDTEVTDQFIDTLSGTAKAGTFNVTTSAATDLGTYTVVLYDTKGSPAVTTELKRATFSVVDKDGNGGSSNNNGNTNVDNTNSDVFGGVTTSLLATDNTDYSLINSGANFSLNGKTYTANQLSWYLTKEVNATPANMGFTSGAGSITASGTGTLKVHVANAQTFANEIGGANIVGIYQGGSYNTIVYDSAIFVNAETAGVVTKHPGTVSISTNLNDVNKQPLSDGSFNGLQFQGVNNKFLSGKESSLGTILSNGRNFNADIKDNGDADKQAVHGSTIASNNTVSSNGVYYETYYVEYFDNSSTGNGAKFVAEIPVVISVNAGPTVEAKENKDSEHAFSSPNSNPVNKDDLYITLDLVNKKTFNLGEHLFSNRDNTTYTYSSDTDNVTIANGVVTAKQEGTAVVTVTPKANGVEGSKIYVFFRVNKQPDDTITVADKNGNQARVLTTREYEGNKSTLTDEKALAAAQVKYIQIDVTGKEGTDKKATLDTKGASDLTFALADPTTTLTDRVSVDSKTGEITIAHAYLNSASFKPFAFAVKVVSTATAKTALTTGYFYIVVDYADAQVTGLEASYEVGTSYTEPYDNGSYLNLSPFEVYGPVHVSSTTNNYSVRQLYRSDDLENEDLYTDDDFGAFDTSNGNYAIRRATVAGKTAHVLIAAGDPDKKIGTTYKVVELKSVAGQSNYVTKIVDADNNTIYDAATSAVSGAAITIDKTTVVTVTVAHKPDASLNAKADPAFTIDDGGDPFNYNPNHLFVAATEDPYTYQITLIPSQKGTQIVAIVPTEGRLSKTDYSLVGAEKFNLTVKNNGEAATTGKPGKVTGVKVSNKKGAKVTVKFDKINSYPTMRYYVQKKIGKKTSGKSVGSTKTTLSVAKGKTVKVRVKAYYYDTNGTKHVGAYSSWKTLKTDKK